MFAHKSYLKLGDFSGTDFMSLIKGGYELTNCEFSFQQGMDDKGKASTAVYAGSMSLTIPTLPTKDIIEWALDSRKYKKGVIVMLDDHDMPVEKVFFENAACINMDIDYTQKGESYIFTKIVLQAERLTVGTGAINFDNEWAK